MKTENRLNKIKQNWFLMEPVLFSIVTTHTILRNDNISVPLRTGKMRIEFSDLLCEKLSDEALEEAFKIEVYRIILKHPYTRKPENCKSGVLILASDVTINQFFKPDFETAGVQYLKFQHARFQMLDQPLGEKWSCSKEEQFFKRNLQVDRWTGKLNPVDDLTFEQWYRKILFLVKETAIAGSQNAGGAENPENFTLPQEDSTELWEENQEAQEEIKLQIQRADREQGFGSLGDGEVRLIQDQCDFSFDYRKALTQFRQSIVTAQRKLTRMRPSRRFGFAQMGSRYERKASVLIAVDVSGSITDESFERFYHAIRNFFFLGIIEKIDLIFFDIKLKNTSPVKFSRNINLSEVKGRGGTNFQCAVDFFQLHQSEYSGMIIFTDGQGDVPVFAKGAVNVLWILENRLAYEKSRYWINTLSGNKCTFLPF